MKSRIFTKAEVKEIERKLAQGIGDPTGIFYGRIKPKIKELLEEWFPRKKELKELIKRKIK